VQLNTFYSYSAGQQFFSGPISIKVSIAPFYKFGVIERESIKKKQTKGNGLICKASFKADNKKPINIKLPRFVARQTFFVLSFDKVMAG
jgi:hypothetical protein